MYMHFPLYNLDLFMSMNCCEKTYAPARCPGKHATSISYSPRTKNRYGRHLTIVLLAWIGSHRSVACSAGRWPKSLRVPACQRRMSRPARVHCCLHVDIREVSMEWLFLLDMAEPSHKPASAAVRSCPLHSEAHASRLPCPNRRCHTKSVITKPQNVFVMRDIMCTGYVAGGNCQFFGANRSNKAVNGVGPNKKVFNREKIVEDMNKRLAFTDDASGEYASMLAFVAPYDKEVAAGHRDQVISISERLLPWEVTRHTAMPGREYFPGEGEGFENYMRAYGLDQLHFGEDVRAAENLEFISQVRVGRRPWAVRRPTAPPACARTRRAAGLRQQRHVLRGPAPPLQPLLRQLL